MAFGALVETGLIAPGTRAVRHEAPLDGRSARRWLAGLRAARWIDPRSRRKPARRTSCNGWSFWHVEQEGELKPIDALRQLYLLAAED